MFSAAGPQEGKLTGAQVKPVMLQSSLPSTVLAKVENIFVVAQKYFGCVHQVWTLADADGDGLLDEAEFCLAMYLIDHKLSGHDLPASLPPHLRPPGTPSCHDISCHVTSCHVVMSRAQAAARAAPAPRGPAASARVGPDQPQPEHRVLGQRGGGHGVLVRTGGRHRASCVTLQYIYTRHLTRPNRLFIYPPDLCIFIFILPIASSRIVLI